MFLPFFGPVIRLPWAMSNHVQFANGQHEQNFGARCRESFRCCAHRIAVAVGSPWAFTLAFVTILAWAVTGPLFKFSDTWQLVINTATTIITFLMVFIIQNTQNRDTRAIQLKLDELLRGVHGARTRLVALETLTDAELDDLEREFEKVRAKAARPKL
jgi:low affinity Fe/Cu permease